MHEEGAPFHCVSGLNSCSYLHAVLSDAQGAHARMHKKHKQSLSTVHTKAHVQPVYTHNAQIFTHKLDAICKI